MLQGCPNNITERKCCRLGRRALGHVPYILMLKGMNAEGEANPTQDGKPFLTPHLPSNNFNSYFQLRLFLKMAVNYVSAPFQSPVLYH